MSETIINTHSQLVAAKNGVAIMPSHGGVHRDYVNGWLVYRVVDGRAVATDLKAHWTHANKKHFGHNSMTGTFHERQRLALENAKKWIAERGWYDGEWKRNRMRDYVPKEIDEKFPLRKNART